MKQSSDSFWQFTRRSSKVVKTVEMGFLFVAVSLPLISPVALALDDEVDCNIPFDNFCTSGGPFDEPPGRDPNDPGGLEVIDPNEPSDQPPPISNPPVTPPPQPTPPENNDPPLICNTRPSLPQCNP
ncbi:hypothetical protein H6F93_10970 [Leptolyngbya sp. FACHB-671]|nr:hypothetical protein [Leptolyngbya sp. FACHB-671]